MSLSIPQLKDVCLLHSGAKQCRFLRIDDVDPDKHYCMKKRPVERRKIDQKVNEFLSDCQKKRMDASKQNLPIGDNCTGYPVLKHKLQGYDVL